MSGTETNAEKKKAAIAEAEEAVKAAEHGTQQEKDDAQAALNRARSMPD